MDCVRCRKSINGSKWYRLTSGVTYGPLCYECSNSIGYMTPTQGSEEVEPTQVVSVEDNRQKRKWP